MTTITSRHEFRSRTQKPVFKVSKEALEIRQKGITNTRNTIKRNLGTELAKECLAAMNFSVSEVSKELKRREKKGGK